MIPIFTIEEFNSAKSRDKLLLRCKQCNSIFYRQKNIIQRSRKNNYGKTCEYCSLKCKTDFYYPPVLVNCKQCNKKFRKRPSEIKKSKNHYCSSSCAATYNNLHKKHGTRRSKLEVWLEEQLTSLYPDLIIDFNKKDAINSELDIYIPSLKLAFELNRIYHYEPIHGIDKMDQVQNNDKRKYAACIENNIELCIIDTSHQKYVKPRTSQKFLDIITSILDNKIKTFLSTDT